MFKVAVAVALVALASAASVNVDRTFQVQPSFEEWRAQFSKTYVSDVEASERAQIYADNIALINEHNTKYAAGEATFTMGVNEYTDMTHEEFKALFIGPKVPAREQTNVADMPKLTKLTGTAGSVDWRAKGAVTPVKNQGQCGSCWSFSTTGSTEGAHQIATGKLVSLSEQQLMDCSTAEGDHSCQGGLMDFAFKYIIQNGGLDTEQDYPYQMRNEPCKTAKEQNKVVSISGYKDIPQGSEEALTSALNIGPVSVAIEADQVGFQHYQSGVFSGMCGTKLDHGVLAVGFGTEGGQDYYIVKNSWGATWGMEGYIMMARGKNECGIANSASYPIAGSGPAPGPAPPGPPPPPPPPPPGPSDCKDYCDPNAGPCAEGEKVQITGIAGSFCSPKCGLLKACPTDVPDGATAKPECVLETAGSSRPTQCALICQPGADAGECPNKATCKPIQGTGVCTYDS